MARTFQLVDSSGVLSTISLILTTGIVGSDRGFGTRTLSAGHIDRTFGSHQAVDSLTLDLVGSTQDNAAAQIQALYKMLRKAQQYWETDWQTAPVYLTEQADTETSARYAIVYGATGLTHPSVLDTPFENAFLLQGFTLGIIREHPWRSAAPAALPTVETLTAVSGSASTNTAIHVPTFWSASSDTVVDTVFSHDNSAGTYSTNQVAGTSESLFKVAGSTPAASDALFMGAISPWHHFVIPISSDVGVFTADIRPQIWSTDAWVELTAGTEFTAYPLTTSDMDDTFKTQGEWVLSLNPSRTWTSVAVNGATKYWLRLYLNAVSAWTTTPVTHATETMYTLNKPYLSLTSDNIGGDTFPRVLLRLNAPSGGATTPGLGTTSRVIFGAKSRNLTKFQSHLNLGNAGNSSDWANTYDTDTTSTANTEAGVGVSANCAFTAVATQLARVTLTGTAVFDDYAGQYRVFVIAEQVGGSAGDVEIKARFLAGGSAAGSPYVDTPEVATLGADKGWEAVDLGIVQIPFGPLVSADSLGIDLVAQVFAERVSGSSTLKLDRLILIPVDEWSCEVDDNAKRDTTSGGTALRGNTALDVDFDVLADRSLRYKIVSGTLYPTLAWNRSSAMPRLEPGRAYRIYWMLLHYPTAFGTGPLICDPGAHLSVSFYAVDGYNTLRGS